MTTANQLIAVNSDVLTSDSVFDMMVSKIDASINWVVPGQLHGYLETRYVRRSEQTVVVYLSSQTGWRRLAACATLPPQVRSNSRTHP